MKRRTIVIVTCVALAAIIAVTLLVRHEKSVKEAATYQLSEVTRGDIENTVSSTGTLSAVQTVNVGSQVSGIISHLYVDFNDNVKKGQVLAVLDTTILAAQVFDSRATLMKTKSQLAQAESEYQRNKPLFENGFLSETEWLAIKTSYDAARAAYESASAALQRAQTNLAYSTITSPIDGTVIERNVDAGQTIASSFQAPTLFIIAQDLSKMEIDVNVDESDIGSIKTGQPVRFTVQAYPDEKFSGVVRQVRLQPTTIQNVVNYTAVVDAANDRGLLLPGMTATVDFIVVQRKDVLLVPNAALVFKPTDEMLAKFRDRLQKPMAEDGARGRMPGSALGETAQGRAYAQAAGGPGQGRIQGAGEGRRGMGRMHMAAMSDSGAARRGGAPADSGAARGPGASATQGQTAGSGAPTGTGDETAPTRVFFVDEKGSLEMAYVMTGTTDGKNTEIKGSSPLAEGTKVIIGVNNSAKKDSQGSSRFSLNPRPQFGPQRRPSGGGGPRF